MVFGTLGRLLGLMAGVVICLSIYSAPALADLKLCNNTDSRVGVAIGYRDFEGWVSEGWWNIASHSCETLLNGDLTARYYYIYAMDYDGGGAWGGSAIFCSRDAMFTIRGIKDCVARDLQQTGFFEVDTKEEPDWTVSLSSSAKVPLK